MTFIPFCSICIAKLSSKCEHLRDKKCLECKKIIPNHEESLRCHPCRQTNLKPSFHKNVIPQN